MSTINFCDAYRFTPAREQPLALALLLAHAAMFGLAMGIEAFYQRQWWLVFGLIASSYSLTLRRVNGTTPRLLSYCNLRDTHSLPRE